MWVPPTPPRTSPKAPKRIYTDEEKDFLKCTTSSTHYAPVHRPRPESITDDDIIAAINALRRRCDLGPIETDPNWNKANLSTGPVDLPIPSSAKPITLPTLNAVADPLPSRAQARREQHEVPLQAVAAPDQVLWCHEINYDPALPFHRSCSTCRDRTTPGPGQGPPSSNPLRCLRFHFQRRLRQAARHLAQGSGATRRLILQNALHAYDSLPGQDRVRLAARRHRDARHTQRAGPRHFFPQLRRHQGRRRRTGRAPQVVFHPLPRLSRRRHRVRLL